MFQIRERGSTVGREVLGGVTTFMAMSYIIFVQTGMLGATGMDAGGIIMATCIAAGVSSILMGLWANYPVALAPGMGENAYFAFTLVPALAAWGLGVGWQMALALTLVPGLIILLLTAVGFRRYILDTIPDSLKSGIAAGIGLFIAVIGFQYANLITFKPPVPALVPLVTQVDGGWQVNSAGCLALVGLAVTLALMAYRVHGAILLGIIAATAAGLLGGQVQWCGNPLALPSGLEKTAGWFVPGFAGLWQALTSPHALALVVFLFVLTFMDLFDSVGTLVAVAHRAGLMRDGKLPRASAALGADAIGTVIGGGLGASTVTSYIESITGVAAGARTGLAAIVAGACMLLAMFFQPLVRMIGGGIAVGTLPLGVPDIRYPLIAPALIVVGSMMIRVLREVDWDNVTEALPAFLTMVFMPLTYSISDGIAIGFVSYAFAKLVSGRARQCPVVVHIVAGLFVLLHALPTPR